MTVTELIARLQECDPDAEVRIMMQESWPFENAITGVAVREDFTSEECDCDHRIDEPHEQGCPAEDEEFEDGLRGNDVLRRCSDGAGSGRGEERLITALDTGRVRP